MLAGQASCPSISVAIPTYRRGQVLIDSIEHVRNLNPQPHEIIIVDQTPNHDRIVAEKLKSLDAHGDIKWIRLPKPSIPRAMNKALLTASGEIIVFLDDDIRPEPDLLQTYCNVFRNPAVSCVAGRVLQPWQEAMDFSRDDHFHFASLRPAIIREIMAGNFGIRRQLALQLGGFDEQFVRVAYRFESEFAFRLVKSNWAIFYEPNACIHHLKADVGGTRHYGEHLTAINAGHRVGEYYYIFRTWGGGRSIGQIVGRFMRAIINRYHLHRPWRIPVTMASEAYGLVWAAVLAWQGPRLLPPLTKDRARVTR